MKRMHAAAITAILAGVPALAQQKPTAAPAQPATITLTGQDGKSERQCKVLRTYKHPDGGIAQEVKDETTGEILTVIEKDAKTSTASGPEGAEKGEPAAADPILQPKDYSPAHVRSQFGPDSKPSVPYTKPPVPATRRWFNFMRPSAPTKPAAPSAKPSAALKLPSDMVAIYHPDPVMRLIGCMTDDQLPSMREVSAEMLAREGKGRPEVVEALLRSAKNDPAPSVRACCCRCLAEMQVNSPECTAVLKSLQTDKNQLVRTAAMAAAEALER